jgi:hypothetical protein
MRTSERDWKTTDAKTDEYLEMLAIRLRQRQLKDDDALILTIGDTGTGKSVLNLHLGSLIAPDDFSIDCISLDRETFADTMNYVKTIEGIRVANNDEANVNRRDSLSKFNKDILNLYLSIRGLNIIHLWCNPSIDLIDKAFVKERIEGVLFITTKSIDTPRIYYYFPKSSILQILEKYKNLELRTLKKVRKKYAAYRGWFKDYDGPLMQQYKNKKKRRMSNVVDEFFEKYGTKKENQIYLDVAKSARKMNISRQLLDEYKKILVTEESNLKLTEDYIIGGTGLIKFNSASLDKILEEINRIKKNKD